MTYKGSNWTRGELGHDRDENPNIECPECGEPHPFKEYWKPRYIEDKSWNATAVYWLCDTCLEQAHKEYELHKKQTEHKQLTAYL